MIEFGDITRSKMNIKKCFGPSRIQDILGFTYDSLNRKCRVSESKVKKYLGRLQELLTSGKATSKDLEKKVGNLVFAAWVIPFGRPFISHISRLINPRQPLAPVNFEKYCLEACKIWKILLARNHGVSFDFI